MQTISDVIPAVHMWSNRLSDWRNMACNRTNGILDIFTPLRRILPSRFSALEQEEDDDELLELVASDDPPFLRAAVLEVLTSLGAAGFLRA